MTRLDELLILWQDQTLTEAQLAELKALLSNAAGRTKAAEDIFLTGVVLESLRAQGAARELLTGRQEAPAQSLRFSRRFRIGLTGVAAALLIAVGVIFWLRPSPINPPPVATTFAQVEQVQGETFVVSKEKKLPLQQGHVLIPGQGIATEGADSEAVVQMENTVRLKLGGDTTVFTTSETDEPKAGPKVVLEQGDLLVEVTRSLNRKKMTVETPIGVAVTETDDAALHISDAAGVVVVRGEVNFTHRQTGQAIRIKAGQYLAGTRQGELHTSQFFAGNAQVWTTFPRAGLGTNALGYALAFAPDGQTLAAASRITEAGVRFGPVAGDDSPQERPGRLCVGISPDGKTLATADQGNLVLYELPTGKPLSVLKGERRSLPTCLAFSPDGKTLAVGRGALRDAAGVVDVWQLDTGTLRDSYRGHAGGITALAFSPDGKVLATGSLDRTVVLWDMATGRQRTRVLMIPSFVAWAVAFSPNGKTLAIATGPDDFRLRQPGDVKLWDVATETVRTTLRGHSRAATSIVFSPDGQSLISGSADTTVRFWDTSSGREYGMLKGHQAAPGFEALAVALSPDGKWLATASFDRTVKLWKATPTRNEDGIRISSARTLRRSPKIGESNSFAGSHFR
jgi:Tol biopolymer transport system component